MRVLLVEDDVRVSSALAAALHRRNYTVTCVAGAEEALDAPVADLVLLDLGLPDGDGLEVCRELRERSPAAPAPPTRCRPVRYGWMWSPGGRSLTAGTSR